jgi:Outer membrane protein beta-barrel domain
MRTAVVVGLIGVLLTATASTAAAQSRRARVPATDMWAVGGSVGAAGPSDPSLQSGLEFAGNLERYLTPRVSVRGQIGGSAWDVTGRHFTGTVSPLFATGNLVYNWEGGVVHPYVTGGLGIYRFRAFDRSDREPGFNLGGGAEYFLNRYTTLTGELGYHKVGDIDTPLATFSDGSFWRFGVGLKRYF